MATACVFTAVHHTGGTRVTWQHAEAYVVLLLLELPAQICILSDGYLFALVARYP